MLKNNAKFIGFSAVVVFAALLGFFITQLDLRENTLSIGTTRNNNPIVNTESNKSINFKSQETFRSDYNRDKDIHEIMSRLAQRAQSVPQGQLMNDMMEAIKETENLPWQSKAAALTSYLTGAISLASFEDVSRLTLSPDHNLVVKLKEIRLLDGKPMLDHVLHNSYVRALNLNKIDTLMCSARTQFETTEDVSARDCSTSLVAQTLFSRGVNAIQGILDAPIEYQEAVQEKLLDKLSFSNRKKGLEFLLGNHNVADIKEEQIQKIVDKDWFLENANEISSQINDAPPSHNRDLVISQMVKMIIDTDFEAVKPWLSQISDKAIRFKTAKDLGISLE